MNTDTKSVYIHIPFCDHICGYCDFTRFLYARPISDAFIMKLISQINTLPQHLDTIYVGGGTPTSLAYDQLESLLQALALHTHPKTEFTFEGNPENITDDKIKLLVQYGVNRMSLGVQTSDDNLLDLIGRHHRFYDVKEAVACLRRNKIHNVSLDLMYGLPGQSLSSFVQSMEDVISLKPDHVSIYALTIEPGSQFGKKGIKPVSSEVETEMFLACIDMMETHGYEHYEISNFSLPNRRSQHNQVYWHYEDFYAYGPGSSMKLNGSRKTWTKNLSRYLREDAYDEIINLSREEEMFEFMMMGLRLADGISYQRFYERFHVSLQEVYGDALKKAHAQGLLEINDEGIKASRTGFIMLDDVLLYFMENLD